jgi:hypothetical protein
MNLVSLSEARESGITRYFTGLPCIRGHVAERMTSTRVCLQCKSEREMSRPARIMTDQQKKRHYQNIIKARRADPQRYQGYTLAWRERNPEKVILASRKRQQHKRNNDPVFALKHRVSCLVRQSLKSMNFKKGSLTQDILNCSNDEFRIHIEKQFTKGMGWHNFSQWHIDHIVPISSAKTEEDVIALNHFTNLRPLWASDNLKKSNKMEFII